jgi:prepilin-type N-terminal cleavage/methylation domain-containing protein
MLKWRNNGIVRQKAGFSAFQYSNVSKVHGSAGFTLIELLVVLVIMLVVIAGTAVTIPSFSSPRQKLRNDARELLTLLREARQTAMLRKMKVDVCVDPDSGAVCMIETAVARKLIVAGESLFDEDETETSGYVRRVSFDEDIELGTFPPEAVKTVFSDEDEPFSSSSEWEPTEGEIVAFTFTTFGGSSGGGISLVRDDVRLDIACDILTGEPEIVELY